MCVMQGVESWVVDGVKGSVWSWVVWCDGVKCKVWSWVV
jgi:hypothetical protein